jgi:hypothetical protein
MNYVIYCDESRHDGGNNNRYMAIGGLWVDRDRKEDLTKELRHLLREVNLLSEIKWSKVSSKKLEEYKKIIDFFFENKELNYRVIVVDQQKLDLTKFHGGDKELGFYKFYYELIRHWILPSNYYLILLDYKKNKGADRYTTFKTILERVASKQQAWITDLTIIDSKESPLAQLSDLLTGAVAASWCQFQGDTAKYQLAEYIASKTVSKNLTVGSASPAFSKFNIFNIRLQ